ncbi:regulator [Chryseolinea lacunae]|uniref:Regulator n=1 Tax=Chryseolinea lacunae TaxID=2801331 RepID=A0ABS1KJM3_9BACT|nr:regulator [Chryseolinea lacunae]MBL0739660.1 regulator [Chryseolinea lacunae]
MQRLSLLVLTALVAMACKQSAPPTTTTTDVTVFQDTAFWQEYHEAYPVPAALGEVRSLAVDSKKNVWIATPMGVFIKKDKSLTWDAALPAAAQGPSFAVAIANDSSVWLSTWNALYKIKNNVTAKVEGPVSPLGVLCVAKEGVYAGGPRGVWLCDDGRCEKKSYTVARSIRDMISDQAGGLWVASDVGLYHATADSTRLFSSVDDVVSAYIRGAAFDDRGQVWAGGLGGVAILKDNKKINALLPEQGIPSINVNAVRRSPSGVMWVGTDVGVVRYAADLTPSLRFSRRWLVDDKVNAITFDASGNAWIGTARGVSAIKQKQMTLASKEQYFYDVLMRRHIRDPWIAGQCRLAAEGDTTKWAAEDDDNDGEYTSNYLAMESFRYAATKSDDAKAKARKAFQFLKLLQEVTETDGFFARTIVPTTWSFYHDGNRTYTERERADEEVKEPRFKPVEIRWRKSRDGRWMWKGDTSSDEICGHMFGYFTYYDLVADETEKEEIRRHVSKIVTHLMKHNFTLTDVDDQPTRWGVWSPDRLNHDPEWSPDRSLNSMEVLSFLKFAYYITRDEKFQSEYLRLINTEGYLDNMAKIPQQNPAWFIYFDVILAAYQYPILLKGEDDPKLKKFYEDHIDQWLARRKDDHNPLINFIYVYARQQKKELKPSVEFLTDTPLDLVDWTIDHTRREDVRVVHVPVMGDLQVNTLQPASIRATVRWDKNPWGIVGGDHYMEREPVFWLLPYWMGRYLDMIQPPAKPKA